MLTKFLIINILIRIQCLSEILSTCIPPPLRVILPEYCAEELQLFRTKPFEISCRLFLFFFRIVLNRHPVFSGYKDQKLQIRCIKPQGLRSIGNLISKVGASPIQYRHKIVTDRPDITGSKISNALTIILDELFVTGCLTFNVIMYRNTFDNRPDQSALIRSRDLRLRISSTSILHRLEYDAKR